MVTEDATPKRSVFIRMLPPLSPLPEGGFGNRCFVGIAMASSWGCACGLSGGQPLQVGRGRGALALLIRVVLP